MSMATLERAIVASARVILKHPKLRLKDLLEWSTGKVEAREGEVALWVPDPGVYICVKKEHDKRN